MGLLRCSLCKAGDAGLRGQRSSGAEKLRRGFLRPWRCGCGNGWCCCDGGPLCHWVRRHRRQARQWHAAVPRALPHPLALMWLR